MKQSNIIFLLFSLSITACFYSFFSSSIFKSQLIHTSSTSNNHVETGIKNKNTDATYYSDGQLTISKENASIDERYDSTEVDNPHLPIAYKIKTDQINPELELEENSTKKSYLEEGQSRTFLYASTGFNNTNPEENEIFDNHENSSTGYFLQPGQSRIFLDAPKDSDPIHGEEG